jgi:TonB family protein
MTAASFFRDLASFSVQIAIVVLVVAALLKVVRIPARARYVCLRLTLLACLVVPWTLRSVVVVTHAPESATRSAVNSPTAQGHAATAMPLAPPSSPATGRPRVFPDVPWTAIGFFTLIAGVAARALWLAIGFFRLALLTRRAVPVESAEYAMVQEQLGTSATISEVDRLAQPVTFGFRRPTVLLPDVLAAAPAPLRRAVVTHELFHVRRGDWLSLLGEEAVRTVLWFHPAVHWLTSSIQLAREEMVDELTVRATGDRRAYMRALLAFADTGGPRPLDWARGRPAPAFAHRRQLFHRILSVSKERVMSAPRIVMSVVALAAAAGGASWYASSAFPIVKAARAEIMAPPVWLIQPTDPRDGALIAEPQSIIVSAPLHRPSIAWQRVGVIANPEELQEVTPENPIPRRTRGGAPAWPSQLAGRQVEVVVNTLVRIDRDGVVTNVLEGGCSVRRGDAECGPFFAAAATAIRQWRYDRPVRGPLQFNVAVTFRPGAEAVVVQSPWAPGQQALAGDVDASEWLKYVRETQESLRSLAQETGSTAINQRAELLSRLRELERAQRLALERGSSNADLAALQQETARLNDQLARDEETLRRAYRLAQTAAQLEQAQEVLRAARAAEEAARDAEAERAVRDARVRALAERGLIAPSAAQQILAQAPNQRPLVSPSGKTPLRVGDPPGVQAPIATKKVNPEHPLAAMQARVAGTVILEALVDERGNVADARVARSIPLLDQAALDAVKQWQFKPATLNGEAVPVIVQIEMNFTLK